MSLGQSTLNFARATALATVGFAATPMALAQNRDLPSPTTGATETGTFKKPPNDLDSLCRDLRDEINGILSDKGMSAGAKSASILSLGGHWQWYLKKTSAGNPSEYQEKSARLTSVQKEAIGIIENDNSNSSWWPIVLTLVVIGGITFACFASALKNKKERNLAAALGSSILFSMCGAGATCGTYAAVSQSRTEHVEKAYPQLPDDVCRRELK